MVVIQTKFPSVCSLWLTRIDPERLFTSKYTLVMVHKWSFLFAFSNHTQVHRNLIYLYILRQHVYVFTLLITWKWETLHFTAIRIITIAVPPELSIRYSPALNHINDSLPPPLTFVLSVSTKRPIKSLNMQIYQIRKGSKQYQEIPLESWFSDLLRVRISLAIPFRVIWYKVRISYVRTNTSP